jgi:hypothetical protein
MVRGGDAARRRAVECIALANESTIEERSNLLRAMARCWVTLAIQMDRLEATTALQKRRIGRGEARQIARITAL